MTVSTTCVRRENLKSVMLDSDFKWVSSAKQKLRVGHKIPVTAPHPYAPPVSAGQPATKRSGQFESEKLAKRPRVDQVSQTIPCLLKGKSLSLLF